MGVAHFIIINNKSSEYYTYFLKIYSTSVISKRYHYMSSEINILVSEQLVNNLF